MTVIERFEDLIAWQKAREITKEIYKLCSEGRLAKDFGLKDQMQRSAVSIMSNIAEGFERGYLGEFQQFLFTAKASCAELRSQIYITFDVGYIDENTFNRLMQQATELSRIIGGLRSAVQKKKEGKKNSAE